MDSARHDGHQRGIRTAVREDEYEKKIATIAQHVHDGHIDEEDWDHAVSVLSEEDHYLLVLIDSASKFPAGGRSPKEVLRLFLAACLVIAVMFAVIALVDSHVADKATARLLKGSAFVAVLASAMFLNQLD